MNVRMAIAISTLAALFVGCGQSAPQPKSKPQTAAPENELDRVAREMAEKLRAQGRRAQGELDDFAGSLEDTVRQSQDNLHKEVKKQTDEMAEYAAQMAEDAKDRALDIPDVLDEFFGSATPRRDWRNRSGQRPEGSRR